MISFLAYWFLIFFIFSVLGYFSEVIYCYILTKKIINRGFMRGPYCPIYGVGAISILILLRSYYEDPIVLFILGTIICSTIEYITSYLLEKIFHNKWWDYKNRKYNINGRVCLINSLLFGVASLVVVYVFYPIASFLLKSINHNLLLLLSLLLFIEFVIDLIYSTYEAYKLTHLLNIVEKIKKDVTFKIPMLFQNKVNEALKKYKSYPKHLLNAFPNIKFKHQNNIKILINAIKNNRKK